MTNLAAQVLAALDRAEETAQAATPGPWEENRGDIMGESEWSPYVSRLYLHAESAGNAAHIAANDPAHVLRLTTALREVVAEVERWTHTVCDDPWYTCPAATEERDGGECIRERGGPCDCGRDARAARTLAALASVWDVPGDNT